jgi:transglutaminase-like putative cysteine protease
VSELTDHSVEEHFHIRFLTRYEYQADVIDNLNALRVRPASNSRQRVEEFSVRITPDARQHRHDDYFGTEVIEFEVTRPHRELTIDVSARVTTKGHSKPGDGSWDALAAREYREAGGEFLIQTDDAPGHPLLLEIQQQVGTATSPLEAVMLVAELVPERLEYRTGATYVDSPITDALDAGAGVCQDFAQIGLNLLRHHGIAGRYVSGYLFSAGDSSDSEQSVEVDTHAWIEALIPGQNGSEPQWFSVDPTNRGIAGPYHVKIGHGRNYADVPPIKGVYRGQAESTLDASVTMTRGSGPDTASMART